MSATYATRARVAQAIASGPFDGGLALWNALGYASDKTLDLPGAPLEFWETIADGRSELSAERAHIDRWDSAGFLFQLTNDEIPNLADGQSDFQGDTGSYDAGTVESFVFLWIRLQGEAWSRTDLSRITREVNRAFPMPAIIAFQHGRYLSIAVIDRRANKREPSKDVIDAKRISIVKNIDLSGPHAAHVRILEDLSIDKVGERAAPRTFRDLYDAWMRALSVKTLNRRFYRELADWFFWACDEVTLPAGGGEDPKERNATGVIRLITRLIFIWFLKERGLVPNRLFAQSDIESLLVDPKPEGGSYYRAILQNLFFATLNTEPNERAWATEKAGRGSAEYLDSHAFRYKDLFKNQEGALSLFSEVPFLNGGLFECLDRIITDEDLADHPELEPLCVMEGKQRVQRVDGFSRRGENSVHIPNRLFFQSEPVRVDRLNEVYDTSGREYKVRGLFPILNDYKFTIDENTPVEEEVALDPELLGKVFENLLASFNPETKTTARKQTGSFYTPREIADYMVDEALHCRFTDAMRVRGFSGLEYKLRLVLGYGQEVPELLRAEREALIEVIDTTRVLDPACGSGAFPIGALQKLVHVLQRIDPQNENWYRRQLKRVDEVEQAAMEIEDDEVRRNILENVKARRDDIKDAFERNDLDYGRKLFLIENCIFGVDIQPIAVQISKLRVFVSLMVSERIDRSLPNQGIRSLPNLETNFVAANTLVKLDRPENLDLFGEHPDVKKIEEELRRTRRRLFTARKLKDKKELRKTDETLRRQLAAVMKRVGYESRASEAVARWDPYQQNVAAGFFEPLSMFVVDSGFDIVIGNPPYLRVQGLQQTQPTFMAYYREHYKSASGSFDLYGLFLERGLDFLSESGQLVYILPHKFFQASFAVPLRKLLNQGKHLRQIVRFGAEQVFEEATTYTCLLFLSRKSNDQFNLYEVRSLEEGREVLDSILLELEHHSYSGGHMQAPTSVDWDFTVGAAGSVLQRLQKHKRSLETITRKIFVGLQTSSDKLFVLELISEDDEYVNVRSRFTDRTHKLERALVKPFLMGKDVHRYEPPIPENVVIFPYDLSGLKPRKLFANELKQRFPVAWREYLEPNLQAFAAREGGKLQGESVFLFGRPQNLDEFQFVKVMTPEIAARCEFTLDSTGGLYHTTKVYSLALMPAWESKTLYLLGLLNSKVLWFFIKSTGYVLRGGFYTFKTDYLKPFPIPESDSKMEANVESLVKAVMKLRRFESGIGSPQRKSAASLNSRFGNSEIRLASAFFEQLIDALIYELYFPEEFADPERRLSLLLDTASVNMGESNNQDLAVASTVLVNSEDEEEPRALMMLFRALYDPSHPVRRAVYALETIEPVRIIEAASR